MTGLINEKYIDNFIPIGAKKTGDASIFDSNSMGVATNRDAWIYNSSLEAITKTVKRMIETYNVEVERFTGTHTELQGEARRQAVSKFCDVRSKEDKLVE